MGKYDLIEDSKATYQFVSCEIQGTLMSKLWAIAGFHESVPFSAPWCSQQSVHRRRKTDRNGTDW